MAKARLYKNNKGIFLYLSGSDLQNLKFDKGDQMFVRIDEDGYGLKMRLENKVKI